jgi:hypothetical protein
MGTGSLAGEVSCKKMLSFRIRDLEDEIARAGKLSIP